MVFDAAAEEGQRVGDDHCGTEQSVAFGIGCLHARQFWPGPCRLLSCGPRPRPVIAREGHGCGP
eukprot:69441-Lingulodinium_polyedra.AAC.1